MESRSSIDRSIFNRVIVIVILTLIASMLPEVLFREWMGSVPTQLSYSRLIVLILVGILSYILKREAITKYCIVLGGIVFAEIVSKMIYLSPIWQETFNRDAFVGNFGSSILLRAIGTIPVIIILILLFKSPKEVYLAKGDLFAKASAIKWLGIKEAWISWGKLAIISAALISMGTIGLTMFTVTGASSNLKTDQLLKYFPFVLIFAGFNSLCEGIVFRSAILGSLKNVLPKGYAVIIAALIFGIGHYYGAPSGIIGVFMSGLLGWYMCRSMYETKGFAASWVIHFMQDVVIFSTILLLGQYT